MIKEQGVVVKLDGEFAWVETSIKSTCSSCAAKSNCGTSAIASAVAGKSVVNKVVNHLNAENGAIVEIGIAEDTIVSGAFYMYILPLITAMFLAFSAQFWLSNLIEVTEPMVILFTFIGGALGFYLAKLKLSILSDTDLLPQLLKIVPQPIEIKHLN